MKKEIRTIIPLLFALFIIITSSPASATTTTITIGDSDIFSATAVTVPILINNVEDVVAATIRVSYDPSVIVVTAAGNSDFQTFISNLPYTADEGRVNMTAYQVSNGLSGDVKFAELTIAPRGSKGESCELTIVVETLSDSKGMPIDAEVEKRSFYIGEESDSQPSPEPSPSPTSTPVPSGDETIPAAPSPIPSPIPSPSTNETIPPSPSPSPSPLPALKQTPAIMTVHVQVGSVTVEKGETANTSIMIKGIGEEGLSCARITLNYDSSVVEVESVGGSEFDTFVENNVPSEGCLKMVAFQMGADPVRGDIKFAEIKLRAAGKVNKSSELSLEINELKDNEGRSVRFERKNGFFSITGEEKTEALSAAIWIWGVLGVVLLLVVVIAGVWYIKKKRK